MSFRQLPYSEALEKQIKRHEAKKDRPKSAAAKAWAKRSREAADEKDELLEEWKLAIRTRDGYRCQFPGCKVKDDHIDCHHIAERSLRKDLIYVVDNGMCLCRRHHDWIPLHRAQAIEMGLLSERSRELAAKEGTLGIR